MRVDQPGGDGARRPHRYERSVRAGTPRLRAPARPPSRGPTAAIRPSQHATTGASAASRPTDVGRDRARARRPGDRPIRTPPAIVTTSAAPTTSSPGVGSSLRPPSMTRNAPVISTARRHPGVGPGGLQPELQRLHRREVAEPQVARRRREATLDRVLGRSTRTVRDGQERRQRRQADQLRFGEVDPILGGHVAHGLPDEPERRDLEVEQIHRHLRATQLLDPEPVGLDPWAARRRTRGHAGRSGCASSTSSDARLML